MAPHVFSTTYADTSVTSSRQFYALRGVIDEIYVQLEKHQYFCAKVGDDRDERDDEARFWTKEVGKSYVDMLQNAKDNLCKSRHYKKQRNFDKERK